MKRVLVTGGAGMIGRRVVEALNDRNVEVAVFDNLSSGLAMPSEQARTVVGDIRDSELLSALCRSFRPDGIIHLAAVHHIPTCEIQRSYCLEVNIAGTENLLRSAEECGAERVVIASSGAVYNWRDGPLSEDENQPDVRDNYALSKLCNESQLRFWSERSGGIGRVARIFNTIAHDDPNAHLIPDILTQIKHSDTEPATVYLGNLNPRRDYLHADEAAAGLLAVLMDPRMEVAFDVLNLCSGTEYSVAALAAELANQLGRQIRIVEDDNRKRRIDRPSQCGDPGKTQKLLGWSTSLSLSESLRKTLLRQ